MIISPSDVPTIGPMGEITYDLLKQMGMNTELAATDWATLTNRRASREPVDKGGWSIFHTWAASTIIGTPVEHFALRGLGQKAWAGWFEDERIEQLRKLLSKAAIEAVGYGKERTDQDRARMRQAFALSARSTLRSTTKVD